MHGFGIRVVKRYINPANVDEAGFAPATTVLQTAALPLELFIHSAESARIELAWLLHQPWLSKPVPYHSVSSPWCGSQDSNLFSPKATVLQTVPAHHLRRIHLYADEERIEFSTLGLTNRCSAN